MQRRRASVLSSLLWALIAGSGGADDTPFGYNCWLLGALDAAATMCVRPSVAPTLRLVVPFGCEKEGPAAEGTNMI